MRISDWSSDVCSSDLSADLSLGKASAPGDWRFTWGYAMAQNDAVLAAFSQDNIGLGTNYRVHALTVDYVPTPKTMLSAYWYHYKTYSPLYAGAQQHGDWLARRRSEERRVGKECVSPFRARMWTTP